MNGAARFRTQLRETDGHAWQAIEDTLGGICVARMHEEALYVRTFQPWPRANETMSQPGAER
jgi:hypothetical protein